MAHPNQEQDFASVKARLDEIVRAVSDDDMPLDDALALYEEAVALGLRVSDLLEEEISIDDEADDPASEDALPDDGGEAAAAETQTIGDSGPAEAARSESGDGPIAPIG